MAIDSLGLPARYKVNQEITDGGMGDVYVCEDLHLERSVAIKVLKDHVDQSRMHDEINALTTLRSKHVVQVYDIVIGENNVIGIVLEFIDGEDITPASCNQLDFIDMLKMLWQIASGINDIHKAGIIHRDLKLNNILLDKAGITKIFDFGLSREAEKNSHTLGFKGTEGYAAPELFKSGFVNFTTAVDVYAFGIIALILTTGKIPDKMRKLPPILDQANIFDSSVLAANNEIVQVLEKCLQKNPNKRPGMNKVVKLLGKYLTKNRHQGLAVISGKNHILNKENREISIESGDLGAFKIKYDGLNFTIILLSGDVYVNAGKIESKKILPGSCVITLGQVSEGRNRAYVTFDTSNPEIVL